MVTVPREIQGAVSGLFFDDSGSFHRRQLLHVAAIGIAVDVLHRHLGSHPVADLRGRAQLVVEAVLQGLSGVAGEPLARPVKIGLRLALCVPDRIQGRAEGTGDAPVFRHVHGVLSALPDLLIVEADAADRKRIRTGRLLHRHRDLRIPVHIEGDQFVAGRQVNADAPVLGGASRGLRLDKDRRGHILFRGIRDGDDHLGIHGNVQHVVLIRLHPDLDGRGNVTGALHQPEDRIISPGHVRGLFRAQLQGKLVFFRNKCREGPVHIRASEPLPGVGVQEGPVFLGDGEIRIGLPPGFPVELLVVSGKIEGDAAGAVHVAVGDRHQLIDCRPEGF